MAATASGQCRIRSLVRELRSYLLRDVAKVNTKRLKEIKVFNKEIKMLGHF